MAKTGKGMGRDTGVLHQTIGQADETVMNEDDLAELAHGLNRLQADDQARVHNQRRLQPGQTDEVPPDFDDPAKPETPRA